MDTVVYICEGSCAAEIAEEEYNAGLTHCQTEDCTMYNHAFQKRMKCATCKDIYKEGENHTHESQ